MSKSKVGSEKIRFIPTKRMDECKRCVELGQKWLQKGELNIVCLVCFTKIVCLECMEQYKEKTYKTKYCNACKEKISDLVDLRYDELIDRCVKIAKQFAEVVEEEEEEGDETTPLLWRG